MVKLIDLSPSTHQQELGHNKYLFTPRGLTLAGQNALVLLPDFLPIRALAGLYERELFNRKSFPVCYIPDTHYSMDYTINHDTEILSEIQGRLESLAPADKRLELHIHARNPDVFSWLGKIDRKTTYTPESDRFLKNATHKGIFHRYIATLNVPAVIEKYPTIRVPLGYIAASKTELQRAYELLHKKGIKSMMAKKIRGSGGHGITPIYQMGDIDGLSDGLYALQEKLELDRSPFGTANNCGIAFYNKKVFCTSTQLLNGTEYTGAISPFVASNALQSDITAQTQAFLSFAVSNGMKNDGGIDFLISNDKAWLTDNNLGRKTATHSLMFFRQAHAPERPFASFTIVNQQRDILEVWDLLKTNNLAFDKSSGKGAFPFSYIQNENGRMVAFHDSQAEAYALSLRVQALLN